MRRDSFYGSTYIEGVLQPALTMYNITNLKYFSKNILFLFGIAINFVSLNKTVCILLHFQTASKLLTPLCAK